ncbi:MAG: nitrite/sulfite reductase [Campylobacterota bacterium]|nr:nitrite/sulfite reductase [Campylobacterota bacterium]
MTTIKANKIERLKATLKPYDFLPEVSSLDLNNLTEEERFYLKNFGIYNHKLSPVTFMIRVRITAGRIVVSQLAQLVQLSEEYSFRMMITARAQIELHGMNADNVLNVWKRLEEAGFTTWQTLTDNFRNIVTDPFDGEGKTNHIEVYLLIKEMESLFLKNPDYVGTLPRKFNTAICGTLESSHSFFSNDLYFALAKKELPSKKEAHWGFNLYLGGKNSEMAQDADIFVRPEEVILMFEAVIKTYMNHGLRGTRSKTRLFHMLQKIGMESFKTHLRSYYPKALQSAGRLQTEKSDTGEFIKLHDGRYAFCYPSRFGEISTDELSMLTDYASREKLSIRLGVDQNIYLFGLKEPPISKISFKNLFIPARLSVCAGNRYCDLSLFDMKEEAKMLPLERLKTLNVSLGYSGCLKGCGKHQHMDIGLVGLRTAIFGPTQKSVRFFIGGQYTYGKAPARLILYAVPLHGLNDLIHVVLDEFAQSAYSDFERFSQEVLNRFSTNFLALWFLSKLYFAERTSLKVLRFDPTSSHSTEEEKKLIKSTFPKLKLSNDQDTIFHKEIRQINQMLWGEH